MPTEEVAIAALDSDDCKSRQFFVYFAGFSVLVWRGAGAVELATLERWYTRKGIVGSNPTLSAIFHFARISIASY